MPKTSDQIEADLREALETYHKYAHTKTVCHICMGRLKDIVKLYGKLLTVSKEQTEKGLHDAENK